MADSHHLLSARRARFALAGFFALGVALGPARSLAQPAPATVPMGSTIDRARALFETGVALAQQERWAEAAESFRQSRAALERPRTAFNLALALQRLGRLREANAVLDEALAMPPPPDDPTLTHDATSLRAAVRGALATLVLSLSPQTAEVTVRVDGVPRAGEGATRLVELDPGRHVVQVESAEHEALELELTVTAADRVLRSVVLRPRAGHLRVRPNVATATVSVDDVPLGRGAVAWSGAPGLHRLRVEAAGYRPLRQPVTIQAGQTVEVVASLDRAPTGLSTGAWVGIGLGAAAVVAGVLAAVLIEVPGEPDTGTTGQLFQAATARW
jgi:hypothetical protein